MLDSQPTGPDFTVTFPFDVKATRDMNGLAEAKGKQIVYLKTLQDTANASGTPAPALLGCRPRRRSGERRSGRLRAP